jgi:hypothetical protein
MIATAEILPCLFRFPSSLRLVLMPQGAQKSIHGTLNLNSLHQLNQNSKLIKVQNLPLRHIFYRQFNSLQQFRCGCVRPIVVQFQYGLWRPLIMQNARYLVTSVQGGFIVNCQNCLNPSLGIPDGGWILDLVMRRKSTRAEGQEQETGTRQQHACAVCWRASYRLGLLMRGSTRWLSSQTDCARFMAFENLGLMFLSWTAFTGRTLSGEHDWSTFVYRQMSFDASRHLRRLSMPVTFAPNGSPVGRPSGTTHRPPRDRSPAAPPPKTFYS